MSKIFNFSEEISMKGFISLILLSLFIYGCESVSKKAEKAIIGTWSGSYVNTSISYTEKTYFEDGSSCGFLLDSPYENEPGALYSFKGQWKIEGAKLISTVLETTSPYLDLNEEIEDEIVSITESAMLLSEPGSDDIYYRYRILEDRGDRLCKLQPKNP